MDDETLAALEAALIWLGCTKAEFGDGEDDDKHEAAIRALIERERAGGERAQIVAWAERRSISRKGSAAGAFYQEVALDIASGAHLTAPRVLSVNVVEGSEIIVRGE